MSSHIVNPLKRVIATIPNAFSQELRLLRKCDLTMLVGGVSHLEQLHVRRGHFRSKGMCSATRFPELSDSFIEL